MQLDDLFLKACQNGQKSVVITFLKRGGINVDKITINAASELTWTETDNSDRVPPQQ